MNENMCVHMHCCIRPFCLSLSHTDLGHKHTHICADTLMYIRIHVSDVPVNTRSCVYKNGVRLCFSNSKLLSANGCDQHLKK